MATTSSEGRSNGKNYISFFDLDRTMIASVSGRALARGAWDKGLMRHTDLVKALFLSLSYSLRLRDPVRIMHEMISWVGGIGVNEFDELCKGVFTDVLLPSLYREVAPEIEMHRRNNGKTVILSSSLMQICSRFTGYLGMDDVVCSGLEVKDGILTGRADGRLCFGPEKLVRMKEYCEMTDNTASEAWYYADSVSDIPVLETVGHPVCVNPDKKLLKKALANNWKIYYWK